VTLASRLLLAFGLVAILATAMIGLSMRGAAREIIEADFDDRIELAARGARQELAWESDGLRGLLAPLCEHDTFLGRIHLELDRAGGDPAKLDPGSRIALRHLVPDQARALRLDELSLVTGDGVVLAAEDPTRIGARDARLAALLRATAEGGPRLRPSAGGGVPSMEVHCTREGDGVTVALVGARRIEPILTRIGGAYGVRLRAIEPGATPPPASADEVVRVVDFAEVRGLAVAASVPTLKLTAALEKLDLAALLAGGGALGLALAVAVVLARSLSRPIVALAREAREVVSGEPRPVAGRGSRELVELAGSYNRAITELTAMRKRLAITERIAARREVARKVAHEIKNPLAPIRAAVETLRRLRARDDPAFDEYFDEATRTVLDEVHRISNIVTEFTDFARLPAPRPAPIDLGAVARSVATLHASSVEATGAAKRPRVDVTAEPIPEVSADRDQMVQVLTNLVQNGLEAAGEVRDDPRVAVTVGPASEGRVRIVVRDNGPGVSEAMQPRLFEPYATSKAKGTGLGLAIVQRIVLEHGGEIAYRTATKGGAVFEIVLPCAGPPLDATPAPTEE
jgi:signal transduction histidine kinase